MTVRLITTKNYDFLNRLTSINSVGSGSTNPAVIMKMKSLPVLLALAAVLFHALPAHAFYDARQGRWLSRDPIGENRSEQIREGNHQLTEAGPNLHAFVENDPMSKVDLLGLDIGKGGPYALPIDCGTWVCVNGNKSYAFTLIICWDPNKGEKNSFEFMRCKRRVKRLFDLACECAASWATQGRIGNALKKCYDDYGPGTVVPPPQTLPYFPKPI